MKLYNKVKGILAKTMLVALYIGFFFVQLTANFDLQQKIERKGDIIKHIEPLNNSIIFKSNSDCKKQVSHLSQKHNIRLNKRFFPESAPIFLPYQLSSIVRHTSIENASFYSNPFIRNVFQCSYAKRGPPDVV